MSSQIEAVDDAPEIQIRRPLDIGYEFLPEGVSATDFIHYELIPVQKPKLYRNDELPPHELLGDKAVIRRELLEEQPTEHSDLWLKIVKKLNPQLVLIEKDMPKKEPEYLQCHLVDQPTEPRFLPSLMPRKRKEEQEEDAESEMGEQKMVDKISRDETRKEPPILNFQAMEKLKETINWLKFCQEEETNNEVGVDE